MSTIRRRPRLQAARQLSPLTLAAAALSTPALAFSLSWLEYGGSAVALDEPPDEEPAHSEPTAAADEAPDEQAEDAEESAEEPSETEADEPAGDEVEPPADEEPVSADDEDDDVAAHDGSEDQPLPAVDDAPLPDEAPDALASLVPPLPAVELPGLPALTDDEDAAEDEPAEEQGDEPTDEDEPETAGDEPIEAEPESGTASAEQPTWRFAVVGATLDAVTLAADALDAGTIVVVRDLGGALVATGVVTEDVDGTRTVDIPLGPGVYEATVADAGADTGATMFAVAAPTSLLS